MKFSAITLTSITLATTVGLAADFVSAKPAAAQESPQWSKRFQMGWNFWALDPNTGKKPAPPQSKPVQFNLLGLDLGYLMPQAPQPIVNPNYRPLVSAPSMVPSAPMRIGQSTPAGMPLAASTPISMGRPPINVRIPSPSFGQPNVPIIIGNQKQPSSLGSYVGPEGMTTKALHGNLKTKMPAVLASNPRMASTLKLSSSNVFHPASKNVSDKPSPQTKVYPSSMCVAGSTDPRSFATNMRSASTV